MILVQHISYKYNSQPKNAKLDYYQVKINNSLNPHNSFGFLFECKIYKIDD